MIRGKSPDKGVSLTMNKIHQSVSENRFSFLEAIPAWMFGFFTLPVIIGIGLLFMDLEIPIFVPLWFICLPLIALTDREREVDAANGIIITRWKLYRRIQLWKSWKRISDYEAVTCRRAGERGTSMSEQEWVALVRPSAKFSYVTFFYARKSEFCPQARAAALRLSEATGLPIRDYPDRLFHRKAPANEQGGPAVRAEK